MKNPQERIIPREQTNGTDEKLLNQEVFHFNFGGKVLKLFAHKDTKTFSTYIKNESGEHIEGETTSLYKAARQKMQEIADREQHVFVYELRTEYGKMKLWAERPGREIFHWTSTEKKYLDNGEVLDIFHTEIVPTAKNLLSSRE